MEGMFWPTMLAFAPLWAWVPLGLIQIGLFIWARHLPWPLLLIPVWLYIASFLPVLSSKHT